MTSARTRRIAAVILLLAALSLLLVAGGVDRPPAPALGDYPGAADIAERPDATLGERVTFGGPVVATDPVTVRADYGTDADVAIIDLTVTDVDATVTVGDSLRVFGVLTAPDTVRATRVVVVPVTGRWYAWGVSFLAGLWVLGRIVRHWTVDRETGAFRPQTDPWPPRARRRRD